MNKTNYINRHDRNISHLYFSESEDFYKPLCDKKLGIWKNSNIWKVNGVYCSSNISSIPEYVVCKRCLVKQKF